MDAWKSQYFVTYPYLFGREESWSLLLPPGWEQMDKRPLEDTAYFQWEVTNSTILDDLQALIPRERWKAVSYSNVINNTEEVVKMLCDFSGLEFDSVLQNMCQSKLKMSRYTISMPSATKWHKHAKELSRVLPSAENLLSNLRQVASMPQDSDFDFDISEELFKQREAPRINISTNEDDKTVGRNSPCHCGSGIKFKQCHGKL